MLSSSTTNGGILQKDSTCNELQHALQPEKGPCIKHELLALKGAYNTFHSHTYYDLT